MQLSETWLLTQYPSATPSYWVLTAMRADAGLVGREGLRGSFLLRSLNMRQEPRRVPYWISMISRLLSLTPTPSKEVNIEL